QDEDSHHVLEEPADLARTLPVDLEQHVLAGRELVLDPPLARAVVVTVHVRVLEEIPRGDHALEHFARDEVVFATVRLALARLARGVGDRQPDARLAAQQLGHEAGLAGARRGHDGEQVPPAGRHVAAHSMFWTCSRICSISTLSSTEMRVISLATDLEPSVLASRFNSWQRKSRRFPQAPPRSMTRRNSEMWVPRRAISSSTSIRAA